MDCRRLWALAALIGAFALGAASAHAATAPLSQGFEDGAPAWSATGMWHAQAGPDAIQVIPAIADRLVALPDAGFLPAAAQGTTAAWFGEAATGTYCGSDFATIRQTPSDGCTSTGPQTGTLTSPVFSLAGRSQAFLSFDAWWEIEAVNADIADLMEVEYTTDGGNTWWLAQTLNPLDPAWGGRLQSFSDAGARASGVWQRDTVDISGAAGADQVQVRFVFDSVDNRRNGFRGLLVDDLAVVDGLGAVIQSGDTSGFSDDPPALSIGDVDTQLEPDGHWNVNFHVQVSHATPHPVGVHWTLAGNSGDPIVDGTATVPAMAPYVSLGIDVPGTDPPATITLDGATGATIPPGAQTTSTSSVTPTLSLAPVTIADAGDGLAEVTITAQLSAPTTLPVSVDYAVTGSDGSPLATGSLAIPPGSTTATATATGPAALAPFGIQLSNAVNAVIAPGAGSVSSPSLPPAGGPTATTSANGGTSAPAGPAVTPQQIVLGARQTGAGTGPVLGKLFEVTLVSGSVRYHRPGKAYKTLGSGSLLLPMGSVVDATDGRVRVAVESDDKGGVESGEFYAGAFGVFQRPGPAPIADIVLAGGNFSVCPGAARKRAHRSASKPIRQLWSSAKGHFRTKGRYAAATIRGTKWLTEDLCLATRVTVQEGIVGVFDFRRKKTTAVRAGQSITVGALQSARYRHRRGIHRPRLSRAH